MARKPVWRTVKELNASGHLALFVGAGVSIGCGLPSWNELTHRVLCAAWKDQPKFVDHLMKDKNILSARYARRKAGTHFNRIVHSSLYQGDIQISPCVWAIARSGINHICTFNFDDLQAEALLTEGIECEIATPDQSFLSSRDGITLYHPHGILPRLYRGSELDPAKIIFSEDDFHNLYSDPFSWANIIQLSLLTSKSILFIGLSMQDPNLRRLIDIARLKGFSNQHFAIFRDPTVGCANSELSANRTFRKLIELDLSSLGVTPWFVDSHEKIAELLVAISRKHSV